MTVSQPYDIIIIERGKQTQNKEDKKMTELREREKEIIYTMENIGHYATLHTIRDRHNEIFVNSLGLDDIHHSLVDLACKDIVD